MAKKFKGKLPADQREITIVTLGDETIRSWDRGLSVRSAHGMRRVRTAPRGTFLKVEWVIAADGGRGEIIRSLGSEQGEVAWG